MDTVTALSASGPAFIYVVLESLADGGVTTSKLAAAAVTPDRIAPSATVGQVLTTVAAGSSSPLETMSLAGNAVAWQTPATGGDIKAMASLGRESICRRVPLDRTEISA